MLRIPPEWYLPPRNLRQYSPGGFPAAPSLPPSAEPVLIQGIIDAWFEEEDGAVLVDYKTDRIKKGEETVLLERYRLQMIYYARALSQITGIHVKEAILYSLSLQEEIPVPV